MQVSQNDVIVLIMIDGSANQLHSCGVVMIESKNSAV